jgi:hypothetical protein
MSNTADKPTPGARLLAQVGQLSPSEIDILYGLEPVYEPGSDPRRRALSEFAQLRCPHCFERFESEVETIYGSHARVEDCQICCSPMAVHFEIEDGCVVKVSIEKA